jgi:hypothetical protein
MLLDTPPKRPPTSSTISGSQPWKARSHAWAPYLNLAGEPGKQTLVLPKLAHRGPGLQLQVQVGVLLCELVRPLGRLRHPPIGVLLLLRHTGFQSGQLESLTQEEGEMSAQQSGIYPPPMH